MGEWKLFEGETPHVSTAEFHRGRERAPHLEQPNHRPRLERAAAYVREAAGQLEEPTVSDLGCGDGGLLSLIQGDVAKAWGYDFQPTNAAGWAERHVSASHLDAFGTDRDLVTLGAITVVTEVLEHLADPHGSLAWIARGSRFVVASSPHGERPGFAAEEHAWAWDVFGYADLFVGAGLTVLRHEMVGMFQVLLARSEVTL